MQSHIISFAGVKGAAGKSTLCTSLASEWHRRCRKVVVLDLDDIQRSSSDWGKAAKANGSDAPPVVALADDVVQRLPRFARDYEIVLVDCPGRVVDRVNWVLGESSLALLPCGPAPFDVWGMGATLKQVSKVMATHPSLIAKILVAKKPPNTVLGRVARKAFDETAFDCLDTELEAYVDYAYASGFGLGPTTYTPCRVECRRQVQMLVNELEKLMALTPQPKRKRHVA